MAPQPDKSWGKGPTTIEDIADPPGRREPPVRYNVLAGRVVGPSVPAPVSAVRSHTAMRITRADAHLVRFESFDN